MGRLPGLPEMLVILVIVILVFGVGRISKISGEIGSAIREFRKGIKEPEKEETPEASDEDIKAP